MVLLLGEGRGCCSLKGVEGIGRANKGFACVCECKCCTRFNVQEMFRKAVFGTFSEVPFRSKFCFLTLFYVLKEDTSINIGSST